MLYNHGVMQHPADKLPRPSEDTLTVYQRSSEPNSNWGSLSGRVFTDGHATKQPIKEMNRASWAAIEIGEDGQMTAFVRGTVPRALPQTAQSAEYMGASAGISILSGSTVMTIDNLNVVRDLQKPRNMWCMATGAYAGLMRTIHGSDDREYLEQVKKIKSHMKEAPANSREENEDIRGNAHADVQAEKGADLHPVADAETLAKVELDISDCIVAVQVMGKVLPLWPWASHKHKRKPLGPREVAGKARVPMHEKHVWTKGVDRWRCGKCRATTRGVDLPIARVNQRCHGLCDHLVADSDLGGRRHDIVEVTSRQGDFSICRACGRYGMRRGTALSELCDRGLRTRRTLQSWHDVFQKGLHPYSRQQFGHDTGFSTSLGRTANAHTRDFFHRASRVRRLSKKTKPWVAAASGVLHEPQAGEDVQESAAHDGDQQMDDFFRNAAEQVPQAVAEPRTITQEQREKCAANKDAAVERKRAKEKLARSNRVKAEETKRRRTVLRKQQADRDFTAFRKAHDPFWTDDEDEEGEAPVKRAKVAQVGTGLKIHDEWGIRTGMETSTVHQASSSGDHFGTDPGTQGEMGAAAGAADDARGRNDGGGGVPMEPAPGQLENWLELIMDEEAAEKEEQRRQELKECRFGSDEWVIRERARRLRTSTPTDPPVVKRLRTATEQHDEDAFHDWEMGEEADRKEPDPHENPTTVDCQEMTDTEEEDAEPVQPVCKRGVGSVDPMPCICPVCVGGPTKTQDGAMVQEVAHPPFQQPPVCTKCGHDIDDRLCCMARQPQLQSATSHPTSKGTKRAGERQRQEQARRLKERRQLEEDALLRPRAIPNMAQAQNPAQAAMARVRERMLARTKE